MRGNEAPALLRKADAAKLWGELREKGVGHALEKIESSLRARVERRFDARYGLDSVDWIPVSGLTVDSPNKALANLYGPTPAWLMPKFLGSIGEDLGNFSFVDFGSGKGRVLLLAGKHPFRQVIGIEFSREMQQIALENIARFRATGNLRCGAIETIEMDVVDFEIPDGDCILYTYNPFGTAVMRRLLSNIERSYANSPRKIYFIYYDSVDHHLFAGSSVLREVPIRRLNRLNRFVMAHEARLYATLAG